VRKFSASNESFGEFLLNRIAARAATWGAVLMSVAWMSLNNMRLAISLVLALAPDIAAAADLPAAAPEPPSAPAVYAPDQPEWTVTVGLEPRIVPAWPGASDSRFGLSVLPLFSIRKAGTPPEFFGARDSFGFSILDLGQFQLGPVGKLIWQRQASSYTALNGLGDVNYAIQAGGFAQYWPVPWLRLRTEVRQGFGGETGVTGDVFLDAVVPLGQFRLSGGPRMTLQSTAAASPYFSITPAQSAGSTVAGLAALPVYSASGGLYSYGAGGQAEYFFNPQWAAHTLMEYERLTGSAAASPLVTQRGSPNQFTFGVGATYSFNIRQFW
jgi:MipA family protein